MVTLAEMYMAGVFKGLFGTLIALLVIVVLVVLAVVFGLGKILTAPFQLFKRGRKKNEEKD